MQYLIESGLPQYPAGLPDRDVALVLPLYRAIHALAAQVSLATGKVQYSAAELGQLDRAGALGVGAYQRLTIQAGEALGYGDLLALSVSGGEIVAHKADAATLTKPALACMDTIGGLASGATGTALFMAGRTKGISGTAFGVTYYLGAAGAITATAPTTDNTIKQIVGIGLGSAGFYLDIAPVGKVISNVYKPSAAVLRVQYTDGSHTDHAV